MVWRHPCGLVADAGGMHSSGRMKPMPALSITLPIPNQVLRSARAIPTSATMCASIMPGQRETELVPSAARTLAFDWRLDVADHGLSFLGEKTTSQGSRTVKFSIITACRNSAPHLPETIGIGHQTERLSARDRFGCVLHYRRSVHGRHCRSRLPISPRLDCFHFRTRHGPV